MTNEEPDARWRSEKTSAYLSRAAAQAERDPAISEMFGQLAAASDEQSAIIANDFGVTSEFAPGLRARTIAWLIRRFGPRAMRPVLAASKVRGLSVYAGPARPLGHPMPEAAADFGERHRSFAGGTLRAGVFGANDGLVSNTCLVMGVAGAAVRPDLILLAGVAGLLAGAFSMAAGEYISMRSQREMFEYQIAEERDELERYPEEEAEELALIYAARGIPIDEARSISKKLIENPEQALDTLAREELGLNPENLGSPIGAAVSSFLSFTAGAILPLVPFAFHLGTASVPSAAGLAAVALFAIGTVLSLFSGRSAILGGLRMLGIGAASAAATYGVGALFGAAIG